MNYIHIYININSSLEEEETAKKTKETNANDASTDLIESSLDNEIKQLEAELKSTAENDLKSTTELEETDFFEQDFSRPLPPERNVEEFKLVSKSTRKDTPVIEVNSIHKDIANSNTHAIAGNKDSTLNRKESEGLNKLNSRKTSKKVNKILFYY